MNSLDTLAGVAIGCFLLAVAVRGNSSALIETAKHDRAFLKWAIAVGILMYLYGIPEIKGPIALLIFAAFLGLGLTAGDKIATNGKKFWQSLGA